MVSLRPRASSMMGRPSRSTATRTASSGSGPPTSEAADDLSPPESAPGKKPYQRECAGPEKSGPLALFRVDSVLTGRAIGPIFKSQTRSKQMTAAMDPRIGIVCCEGKEVFYAVVNGYGAPELRGTRAQVAGSLGLRPASAAALAV